MEILRIKEWDAHFENSKSRTIKKVTWCPIPNKQDGLSYSRLMAHQNGASIYGVWIAIILICSKHEAVRQGYLTDTGRVDGVPLIPSDIALMSKIPEPIIIEAIEVLKSKGIGWLEVVNNKEYNGDNVPQVPDYKDTTGTPQGHHEDTKCPPSTHILKASIEENSIESIEEKGEHSAYAREGDKKQSSFKIFEPYQTQDFLNTWDSWIQHWHDKGKTLTDVQKNQHMLQLARFKDVEYAIKVIDNSITVSSKTGYAKLYEPLDNKEQSHGVTSNIGLPEKTDDNMVF